jgi:hypothetical protein
MKNWTETIMNWTKYIYINWAFFENEPIKGNFKDHLKEDILSIYKIANLLAGNRDAKYLNF